jgi:hypothetical protein
LLSNINTRKNKRIILAKQAARNTLGIFCLYFLFGKIGVYKSLAKKLGLNTDNFVLKQYSLDEDLPWDNIIIENPGKEVLKNECKRLMKKSDLG